jgi:hypothetical protein
VQDVELVSLQQVIARLVGAHVDPQPAAATEQAETQAGQAQGQARSKRERRGVVAHPHEARNRGEPRPGQRRQMYAVSRVEGEVAQVDEGGLAEVVAGELEMSDVGGDHGRDGSRERGVSHGDALVVVKLARLLLGVEAVTAGVEREHQIRLLDHLAAVELVVVVVHQRCGGELPGAVAGESFALGGDVHIGIRGDHDRVGGVAPARDLLLVDPRLGGALGVAQRPPHPQVAGRHQVGGDVVVDEGGVLVGPGHAVDAKRPSVSWWPSERHNVAVHEEREPRSLLGLCHRAIGTVRRQRP